MENRTILSAGIDIGTTTTQVVFSRLLLESSGGFGAIPAMHVRDREVIFCGKVHETPLTKDDRIDAEETAQLIRSDYAAAGIRREQLGSGAVIITGESAEKRNAREVTEKLSDLAGNFVIAAAGPEFESLLAGKGAGAQTRSRENMERSLNIDIGGGTSNFALFDRGKVLAVSCMDIGGRVIRLAEDGRICSIRPKIQAILSGNAYLPNLRVGEKLSPEDAEKLAFILADALAQGAGLLPLDWVGKLLITGSEKSISVPPECISFSGGVADCFQEKNPYRWHDLGVFLAKAIQREKAFQQIPWSKPVETLRATVIGAGTCTLKLSGSTVLCSGGTFPMKNLRILEVVIEKEEDLPQMTQRLQIETGENLAIFLRMPKCPGFRTVEKLADHLAPVLSSKGQVLPILMEHDFAKALGQSLRRRLGVGVPLLCLDGISTQEGDYIDIGVPLESTSCVPVAVHTLVFGNEKEQEHLR